MIPDACIRSDALPHMLDVGIQFLGEIGKFIHERDTRSQHRVRRVFGQFRRWNVHHDHAFVITLDWRVDRAHQLYRMLIRGTDNNAVWTHEILDRCALLQKFRIGYHTKIEAFAALRKLFGHGATYSFSSTDWDR